MHAMAVWAGSSPRAADTADTSPGSFLSLMDTDSTAAAMSDTSSHPA